MVAGTHLAALCSTPGERNRLELAFRQEGLWRGDGYLCLADHREPARVPRPRASPWISRARSGSDVRLASDACLHAGLFSADRMTDVLVESAGRAVEAGCLRLRVLVEMGWLHQPPGTANDLGRYESAVDRVVSREPAVVLCVYDLHCLDVQMMTTVLTTHQTVFLDGTVLVNPHYRAGTGSRAATESGGARPSPAGARSRRTASSPADGRWDSLTRSELRIVAYVVAGLTNREMAAALVVSRHTVDAHLKHIFVKLDIHTRVELTVLALQQPVD
ncbi:MEDS domain-containing protein [Nocardioides aquiterrae]|uniref:HTH luxR-type domain-containing protein n=1 Tax=Nocardioides aquiterrae TaxID=203799 RepID=A0ABN1UF25_9ACTN